MPKPLWPPENDAFLRSYLNILGVKCCSRRLGVPAETIRERAATLKIKPAGHNHSGQWKTQQVEVLEHLLRAAVRLTGHRAGAVVRRMDKLLQDGFLAEKFDDEEEAPAPVRRRALSADGGPHLAD